MTWYVGLTDDPDRCRQKLGNPPDWLETTPFQNQANARAWMQQYISKPDFICAPSGAEWRYGYWYTVITPHTFRGGTAVRNSATGQFV
jgi:hypothetical protein